MAARRAYHYYPFSDRLIMEFTLSSLNLALLTNKAARDGAEKNKRRAAFQGVSIDGLPKVLLGPTMATLCPAGGHAYKGSEALSGVATCRISHAIRP
jgi:hypothetical protein